jgi:hypothetical protein
MVHTKPDANSDKIHRVLKDDDPRVSHLYSTDWYYYVFSKTETSGEK